jgi:2-polyprenyl-3-methyl-5-hydroxy-6-metoxy-1,4-benzoquinol methylase
VADKLTPEQIREFWIQQAHTHGLSPAASWSDVEMVDLEVREILKWLSDGDRVLDVGCGNGYSSVQFASRKRIAIRGIDYVPELIEQANVRVAALPNHLHGPTEFAVGDVTALDEPASAYDKVIAIRVIINLSDWDAQRAALQACGRIVKPGGLLLLSDATLQGWTKLNAFRAEWGLTPIPIPAFNAYLDETRVIRELSPGFELADLSNFASTYFVGTRVLKPLLAEAFDGRVDAADPNLHWNRWWATLPAWGDYGTQKLFVFRKIA